MEPSIDNLRDLAGQLQRGDPQAWRRVQDELQPGLVHVVRRALRTGQGGPALQRWLGEALRSVPGATGSNPAPGTDPSSVLAWMLCNGIARQLRSGPGREVVSSAETVVDLGGSLSRATR
jgi:hypothetical protein